MLTNVEKWNIIFIEFRKIKLKEGDYMIEKEKDIKQVFDNLSEENKDTLILVAKGMEIAQEKKVS